MGNRSKFLKATGDAIIDLKAVREVLRHRKELRHRYFEFANLEEWIHTNPSDGKEYTTLEDLGCFYDDWKIRYLDKEWIQVLNDLYDCMIIRGIPNSNLPKVASQGRQHSPPEYRSGTLESLILEYQKNIHSEEKITLNEFKTLVKPLLLVHPDPVLKIKGGIGFQDVSIKTLERNDSDDDSCEEEVQHVVEESSSKSLKKASKPNLDPVRIYFVEEHEIWYYIEFKPNRGGIYIGTSLMYLIPVELSETNAHGDDDFDVYRKELEEFENILSCLHDSAFNWCIEKL